MITCLLAFIIVGAQAKLFNYDLGKDWISGVAAQGKDGCKVSQGPIKDPTLTPKCPPFKNGKNARTEWLRIRALGWRVAPKVYYHPQEISFPSDIATWTRTATFFNPLDGTPTNFTTVRDTSAMYPSAALALEPRVSGSHLFNVTYGSVTNDQLLQTVAGDRILGGTIGVSSSGAKQPWSGLAKDRAPGQPVYGGKSSSKVYYTASDPYAAANLSEADGYERNNAILFRFNYWYGWNGCSNQLLGLNIAGKYQGAEYYGCPFGVHEGDLERVQVLVCASEWDDADPSAAIRGVQYAQHEWLGSYDCTKGECPMDVDDTGSMRPVSFAGLFSHASYPQPSPLNLYAVVRGFLLLNIDGIYIGDRTSREGPVLQPTLDNHELLPFWEEMTEEQRNTTFDWATYTGSLGGYYMGASHHSLTCLAENLTRQVTCNESNPAVWYLLHVLDIATDITLNVSEMVWSTDLKNTSVAKAQGLSQPLVRTYTYLGWEEQEPSPIWGDSEYGDNITFACPFSGDPTLTKDSQYDLSSPDLMSFLGLCVGLLVGAGVVYAAALWIPGLHHTVKAVEGVLEQVQRDSPGATASAVVTPQQTLNLLESGTPTHYYAARHVIFMFLGLSLYIAGIVMAAIGVTDVFTAIDMIIKVEIFQQIRRGIISVLVLFGIWQTLLLFLTIFFRRQGLIDLQCFNFRNPFARWRGASRAGWRFHQVVAGLLVIEINTTMLLFAFGLMVWVARYAMQEACSTAVSTLFTFTPAEQVCINFKPVGIDKVLCGANLARACSLFQDMRIALVVFGSLCFILSHLFFITMSAHQFSHLQLLEAVQDVLEGQAAAAHRTQTDSNGVDGVDAVGVVLAPRPQGIAAGRLRSWLHGRGGDGAQVGRAEGEEWGTKSMNAQHHCGIAAV